MDKNSRKFGMDSELKLRFFGVAKLIFEFIFNTGITTIVRVAGYYALREKGEFSIFLLWL